MIDVNNNCTLSENSANCELIGYSNIDDADYKLIDSDDSIDEEIHDYIEPPKDDNKKTSNILSEKGYIHKAHAINLFLNTTNRKSSNVIFLKIN